MIQIILTALAVATVVLVLYCGLIEAVKYLDDAYEAAKERGSHYTITKKVEP